MKTHSFVILICTLVAASFLSQGCRLSLPSITGAAPTEASPSGRPDYNESSTEGSSPNSRAGTTYPVWFGTNREHKLTSGRLTFTSKRQNRIDYGRIDVFVPKAHRFGETGNPFYKRLLRGEFRDDNLVVKEPKLLKEDQFFDEIRQMIKTAAKDGNKSQALVFIHGFNVTFDEAAMRAAQIGFDLKVPGPTAFFSWPSLGSVKPSAYMADGDTIKDSKAALVEFLTEFAKKSGAKNINIIAHSMGNRGLLDSLQQIASDKRLRGKVKFNQIILAAPDINREVFLKTSQIYSQFSNRTTLYTSNSDRALFVAPVFGQRGARAGYFKPYTVAQGVDTIAVPDFDVDQLGHSYFAQAEALLYDINDLFSNNNPPRQRQRVSKFQSDGLQFWELGR